VRAPEALCRDAHLAARGFFVPIEHPGLGLTVPYPGAPFRLADAPWRVARPPRLGEHNDEGLPEPPRCARSTAFAPPTSPGGSPGRGRPASSPTRAPTCSRTS